MNRNRIFALVQAERDYQDAKWGGPNHDRRHVTWDWLVYLMKFLGKACAAAMAGDFLEVRVQLVKVAALCVAALEHAPDLQLLPGQRVRNRGDGTEGVIVEGNGQPPPGGRYVVWFGNVEGDELGLPYQVAGLEEIPTCTRCSGSGVDPERPKHKQVPVEEQTEEWKYEDKWLRTAFVDEVTAHRGGLAQAGDIPPRFRCTECLGTGGDPGRECEVCLEVYAEDAAGVSLDEGGWLCANCCREWAEGRKVEPGCKCRETDGSPCAYYQMHGELCPSCEEVKKTEGE